MHSQHFYSNCFIFSGKRKALSHRGFGWETFTDAALEFLGQRKPDVVWLLMGRHAQTKAKYANEENVVTVRIDFF